MYIVLCIRTCAAHRSCRSENSVIVDVGNYIILYAVNLQPKTTTPVRTRNKFVRRRLRFVQGRRLILTCFFFAF